MAKIDFEGSSSVSSRGFYRTREEWLDWCWERNQAARKRGWQRWAHVRDVDSGNGRIVEIAFIDGEDVADIWHMLNDKPYVPYKWDKNRLRQHFGLIRWRIERGVPPEVFMLWSAEGRRQRRAEIVDREMGYSSSALDATLGRMNFEGGDGE
jgi:hypothetical protein